MESYNERVKDYKPWKMDEYKMIVLKYKETKLANVWPFKARMLVMLFIEKNVITNQIITNYMLTMSINVMTLGADS